jgi:hypothetical protein
VEGPADTVGERRGEIDEEEEVHRCRLADWGIRSCVLDPARLTKELGIQPSRAWAKGETYLGTALDVKTRAVVPRTYAHPWGIWAVETKGEVIATDAESHVLWLLELLEPRRDIIRRYLQDPDQYAISCVIWWESNLGHGGFDLTSGVVTRLAALCHYLQFMWVPFHAPKEGAQ